MTRRLVGGYEWRNELEKIERLGERLRAGLAELGRDTRTVEQSRHVLELVSLSSEVSVKALKLRSYQVQDNEPVKAITTPPWWVTDEAA